MNKEMILAILVAYKAFNDKSLTIRTNEYVVDEANIDVTYHKAGDIFVNLWGDKDKFKEDCIEVIINKVIE